MSRLTFEEFKKLSIEEQLDRYEELSNHDKYLARISSDPGTPTVIKEK